MHAIVGRLMELMGIILVSVVVDEGRKVVLHGSSALAYSSGRGKQLDLADKSTGLSGARKKGAWALQRGADLMLSAS